MQNHIFKNTISAFLVLFFTFSPILEERKVEAQVGGSYPTIGSYSYGSGTTSGGINTYVKGLVPAITQLPGCKKKIKSAIKSLFAKNKGVVAKEASKTLNKSLGGVIDEQQAEADAIHNYDKQANDKLDSTLSVTKDTNKAVEAIDEKENCLDAIGKLAIQRMIQRLTLATVKWIQTGVSGDGGPAFVQNPSKFFRDIAKEEILTFGLQLNLGADCKAVLNGDILGTTGSTNINSTSDCVNPYAKAWFKSQAQAFNKKFTDNARYSLNELIAETTPQYNGYTFHGDFSAGGWNAWTALTTVPANNPVGFGLLAETELSKNLAGFQKSTAEEIQEALKQSNGFLGDQRCADPEGLTKDQHKAALEAGQSGCLRWEYVTPGKIVAEEALKISHFQENNLLKAETLNDAAAAIIDALLQRFSNELYNKGLAGFSDEGSDGGLILNSYAVDGSYLTNQIEKDFPEYLQGSDWFAAHPDFNIRTDLTQAIIDEQRVYVEKLQKQNEVLERVIQWTKVLDYCIPGPSPKKYQEISDIDLFEGQEEIELKFDLAELVLQFDPTGIISGIGSAILEKQHEREVKKIIATHLGLMFGIHIYGAYGWSAHEDANGINQDQIINKDDMEGLGKRILTSYKEIIHNTYFNGSKSLAPMPIVTNEARNEFNRIEGYKEIMEENDDRAGLMKSVVQRLGRIKETIEDLGPVPGPSDPNFDDYEDSLKPMIAEFGRLTGDMVTGDDVARAHKMLQEIEDKETYVEGDLLNGPGGCEEEMIKLYDEDKATYSKFYRRQPYGEPIPYLYGSGEVGDKTVEVANPHERTAWSEQAVKYWNPNDGFLYGTVYWNFWARPYDGGNKYAADDNKVPNPPNLVKIKKALESSCPEFIDVVYFSYPGGKGILPEDIGGLDPVGGGEIIPYGDNKCGVVTKKLEEMMDIY